MHQDLDSSSHVKNESRNHENVTRCILSKVKFYNNNISLKFLHDKKKDQRGEKATGQMDLNKKQFTCNSQWQKSKNCTKGEKLLIISRQQNACITLTVEVMELQIHDY